MERRPLILIGAGGHCRSVIEAAESAGMTIAGILDPKATGDIYGYPILGNDSLIPSLASDHDFVVTVGFITSARIRSTIIGRLREADARTACVIASTAHVSRHARVAPGTVVLHHASVNAGATIGENCIINTAANIEHDVAVRAGTHISTGAMINGGASIGANVFIGSGSVVAQGVSIPDDTIIGARSLVLHDITSPGKYYGIL